MSAKPRASTAAMHATVSSSVRSVQWWWNSTISCRTRRISPPAHSASSTSYSAPSMSSLSTSHSCRPVRASTSASESVRTLRRAAPVYLWLGSRLPDTPSAPVGSSASGRGRWNSSSSPPRVQNAPACTSIPGGQCARAYSSAAGFGSMPNTLPPKRLRNARGKLMSTPRPQSTSSGSRPTAGANSHQPPYLVPRRSKPRGRRHSRQRRPRLRFSRHQCLGSAACGLGSATLILSAEAYTSSHGGKRMGISAGAVTLLGISLARAPRTGTVITFGVQKVKATCEDARRRLARAGIRPAAVSSAGNDGIGQEALFQMLGYERVESLDYYAAEGPTHIHDLNQPVPEALRQRFDLVYDGGTTEHCFSVAECLGNAVRLLRQGGRVI